MSTRAQQRQLEANLAYQDTLRTAGECMHGVTAGELVRPWTGTPVCALCRLRPRESWWRLSIPWAP